jgi:hypothetical protein
MYRTVKVVGGLEVLFLSRQQEILDPGIIIVYGRHQNIELFFAKYENFLGMLVNSGFTAILFDIRNHGKRLLDELQNKNHKNENHPKDMYVNIMGTSMDVIFLSQTIPLYYTISVFGVIGYSMGAHTVLRSMARGDFKMVVSIVGCGDYRSLMDTRGRALPSDLSAFVEKNDPIHAIEQFKDTRLLMLFGSSDELVPRRANALFEQKLLDSRGSPSNQTWNAIEFDCGHEFSLAMQTYILEWLDMHKDL